MASDATWPTEFADFKRLDAVLKCGICYDYMSNCMITSCSHTYCSLCIRKFMQYKNQCPVCFEETYEVHLRNNRPLDEVISIFVKIKDKLQRALRLATIPIPMKDAKCDVSLNETVAVPKTPKNKVIFEPKAPSSVKELLERSVSCSPTPSSSHKPPQPPDKSGEDVVMNGVTIPGIFNAPIPFPRPRKPDEMAKCPVCQVEVPARNINMHLDSCLAVENDVCHKKAKAPRKRDPIPKRLFHLMQDKGLKKILKDYGLNTNGDRRTLINRIQRYTVIYNAENDSANPRTVPELIAQLDREEREEKRSNPLLKSLARQQQQTRVVFDRKAAPQVLDDANKAYREENKDSFKKLIENMRAREGQNIRPPRPSRYVVNSDDEDDPNSSVAFNPDVPTTSTARPGYDSDEDLFSEEAGPSSSKRLINWDKTLGKDDGVVVSDSDEEADPEAGCTAGYLSLGDQPTEIEALVEPSDAAQSPSQPTEEIFDEETHQQTDTNTLNDSAENVVLNTEATTPGKTSANCSDDSIDALFEPSKTPATPAVTPRFTRSARKKKPQSETPVGSSSRGLKRKSDESAEPTAASSLQETFGYLFEKYNGDRVDENIESDASCHSAPNSPERGPQETRRQSRAQPQSASSSRRSARKRVKRSLSPAF